MLRSWLRKMLFGLGTIALFVPSNAEGATIVTSDNQGWVNSAGSSNSGFNGQNTFTGNEFGDRYNSWASFSLPVLPGTVTSATLYLDLKNFPGGDLTPYTADIYDVNTALAAFLADTSGVAGYTDLGTGNLYGTTISPGVVAVTLSAQAIADINAASGGTFIVGFTNFTLNSQDPTGVDIGFYNNGFFGDPDLAPQLELTFGAIPEPTTLAIFGIMGVCGYCGYRRRQQPVSA